MSGSKQLMRFYNLDSRLVIPWF